MFISKIINRQRYSGWYQDVVDIALIRYRTILIGPHIVQAGNVTNLKGSRDSSGFDYKTNNEITERGAGIEMTPPVCEIQIDSSQNNALLGV